MRRRARAATWSATAARKAAWTSSRAATRSPRDALARPETDEADTSPRSSSVRATVTANDVSHGAQLGDAFCAELLARSGRLIGESLAPLVNLMNPGQSCSPARSPTRAEADPQRRLRLNISNKILEQMHPADLADIVEELSPDDREAIFETIDHEVAAETLSEIEPDVQASILESLETEKAADIVEEMSPHEAADVLAELGEETSEEILEEMEVEPKAEVEELLEYRENSAGGLMNTEFVALPEDVTVAGAMEALKAHEKLLESLNTLFLVRS